MRARAIAISLPLIIAACGGGDSTEPNDPVASVTISPATSQLTALSETVQLTAAVRTQGGATSNATATWQSSAPQIATVDANGLVRAIASGNAQITATVSTVSGTADVTVQQVAMRVSVTPARDSLFTGATLQLTATATDRSNAAIASPRATWSSNDTSVAAVSATGLVTGRKRGQARITARVDTASAGTDIIVRLTSILASRDTVLAGALQVDRFEVATGRTVTLSGDLTLRAEGPVVINGTIRGDCRALDVVTLGTIVLRGTLDNSCSDLSVEGQRLRLVSGGAYTLDSAAVYSSGEIYISNDTTIVFDTTSLGATIAARRSVQRALGNCTVSGAIGAGYKRSGGANGIPAGRSGNAPWATYTGCAGDLTVRKAVFRSQHGRDGGDGTSNAPGVPAIGGRGSSGADIGVVARGQMTVEASNFIPGDGGHGGKASSTPSAPGNAQANAGGGGHAGSAVLRATQITFVGTANRITFGFGGSGGDAVAVALAGADATPNVDAQKGSFARASAGQGGGFLEDLVLGDILIGQVQNPDAVVVDGPVGGLGGTGDVSPGNGGNSSIVQRPHGGAGGDGVLSPGFGGAVFLSDNRPGYGFPIGLSGSGGDGRIRKGNGGVGVLDCRLPMHIGGNGGAGGTVDVGPRIPRTEVIDALNGRDGQDGIPPGSGGAAGRVTQPVGTTPLPVDVGVSRQPGTPGKVCGLSLAGVVSYLSGDQSHLPFLLLELTTIFQIAFAPLPSPAPNVVPRLSTGRAAPNAIVTVSGNQRWQTFSGPMDETGTIDVTFTGTFAGFPNIPARFIGRITTASDGRPTGITGTIEVGLNGTLPGGQSTTYQVRGGT